MNANVPRQMLDAIAQLPDDQAEVARKSGEDRRMEQYCLLSHAHEEVRNCADTLDLVLCNNFLQKEVPAHIRGPLQLVFSCLENMVEKLEKGL